LPPDAVKRVTNAAKGFEAYDAAVKRANENSKEYNNTLKILNERQEALKSN